MRNNPHRDVERGKILARSYDYVIVGAGSAGCVVARRLLDGTDATVLLLEAGGPVEDIKSLSNPPQWIENIGSRYDWSYHYEPSPLVDHRSLPLALGKVLGGSGSINAMVWTRGHRADYDGWAEAGNAGWDFNSVLPLFQKAEDWEDGASEFRGAGGPIHVERARDLDPVSAGFSYPVAALIEHGLYGATAAELLDRLRVVDGSIASVMLIGHNPAIQELAIDLVRPAVPGDALRDKFPTGGLATLELASTWTALASGSATLTAFITPRQLKDPGSPERSRRDSVR